ncbi:hypothetical protein M9H77_26447 [Catharanthus roseus]|uniref:Uncharacterized protein n=1 Tax=Catharanthus roseus TaxID=4058 RepID=A0ACC0AA30_CATRO|nr:hypothetical protein M9H77_26447 [Catharanthus roseus]
MCYVIAQQFEVRPSGRRGDDDLDPVTDRTYRVEWRTVTSSSRGVRGRHSTSDLPSTPNPLLVGFHYDTVCDPYLHAPTVRPHLPYRFLAQESLNEFSDPARQLGAEVFLSDDYGVSSSKPFIGRLLALRALILMF